MCTNANNIRDQLRENERRDRDRDHQENGDGGATLIQDFTFQMTSSESFFTRATIGSVIFLLGLLISKQIEWAAFVFDLLKPLYFLYFWMAIVVDVLSPILHKFEAWYFEMLDYFNSNGGSGDADEAENQNQEEAHSVIPRCSINEEDYDDIVRELNIRQRQDVNRNELFENPSIDANMIGAYFGGSTRQNLEAEADDRAKRSRPTAKEIRRIRSRGRAGDAHSQILKALESELRKETVNSIERSSMK